MMHFVPCCGPEAISGVWQDSGRTIPATKDGDPAGSVPMREVLRDAARLWLEHPESRSRIASGPDGNPICCETVPPTANG